MSKTVINPPELFDSLRFGFSQIAIADGKKTIYISGQVGWNNQAEMIGKNDFREQTFQAFRNLETALKCADAALSDVVSLRIYIHQAYMAENKAISEALKHFFPHDPPTTNWIGVPCLADPEFWIEIEAIAVI